MFARVSIPVIPKYQAAIYNSTNGRKIKDPSDENKDGKGKKPNIRIPLGSKLDKIRNDRTELFLTEILKGSILKRAQLAMPKGFQGSSVVHQNSLHFKRESVSRESREFQPESESLKTPRPPSTGIVLILLHITRCYEIVCNNR